MIVVVGIAPVLLLIAVEPVERVAPLHAPIIEPRITAEDCLLEQPVVVEAPAHASVAGCVDRQAVDATLQSERHGAGHWTLVSRATGAR